jgi:hypothetical protein
LASEVLATAGISCLRIAPLAGHLDFTRLTIAGIDDRSKAARLWLQSAKIAEKVMREVFSDRRCRRGENGGLIIEANVAEVERLVLSSASLIKVTVGDDAWIDAALGTIAMRIDATVRRLKEAGRLKAINATYSALPANERPPYNKFLTERLRGVVAINKADVPLLLSTLRRAA